MLHIDLKFVSLISTKLERFRKTGDYLWNFRCPICGDSQKSKSKTRGYLFKYKDGIVFKCHNCNTSHSLKTFLELIDVYLYSEYLLECVRERAEQREATTPSTKPENAVSAPEMGFMGILMDRLDTLPEYHPAIQFVKGRKIPESCWSDLYFIEDMATIDQVKEKYKGVTGPRLIIPYYNALGKMIGCLGRSIDGQEPKYITYKATDDPLLFGLHKIKQDKRVYIVEGPIDSLFLPNCLAVMGVGFNRIEKFVFDKNNTTIIIDNQPRNKEVLGVYRSVIKSGFPMFIWPESITAKDINDLILEGWARESIKELIDNNTFVGLELQIRFNEWKKLK